MADKPPLGILEGLVHSSESMRGPVGYTYFKQASSDVLVDPPKIYLPMKNLTLKAIAAALSLAALSAHAGYVYKVSVPGLVVTTAGGGSGEPEQPPPTPGSVGLSAAALDFATVEVGQQATLSIQLSNPGQSPVALSTIAVSGSPAFTKGSTTCGSQLPAGGSCQVGISFSPNVMGALQATLAVSASDGQHSASLTGFGTLTSASLSPNSAYNFGAVVLNELSGTRTFTLVNDGNQPISSVQLGLGGGFASQVSGFNLSHGCGSGVAPGASCTAQVYFRPSIAGTATTTLEARAGGKSFSIALSGEGKALQLQLQDNAGQPLSALSFGDVGGTSVNKVVRVANLASAPGNLTVSSVMPSSAPFTVTAVGNAVGGATCTSTTSMQIVPGGSCDITVTASPGTPGSYTSGYSLNIQSNANTSTPVSGGASVNLPLSATVMQPDPLWGSVKYLWKFDGAHGSTSYVDRKSALSLSSTAGSPSITTTASVGGGASLNLPGSANLGSGAAAQTFGTANFTIEAFVRQNSPTTQGAIFGTGNAGALTFYICNGGTNLCVTGQNQSAWLSVVHGVAAGNWFHAALVRNGTSVIIYVNGSEKGRVTTSASFNSGNIFVGRDGGSYLNANIDELRVTNAVRYTGNFTPQFGSFADF